MFNFNFISERLTDFGYNRNIKEAISFYFELLLLVVILYVSLGVIFGGATILVGSVQFYQGAAKLAKLGGLAGMIVLCPTLGFYILKKKQLLGNYKYIFLVISSSLLAAVGGVLLGLMPIAFLTTRKRNKDKKKGSPFVSFIILVFVVLIGIVAIWQYNKLLTKGLEITSVFQTEKELEKVCSNDQYSAVKKGGYIVLNKESEERFENSLSEKGDLALKEISDLTCLEKLELVQEDISDLSSFSKLNNLKELNLEGTEVSNLSPITELDKLRKLNLERTEISSITALSELDSLKELKLSYLDRSSVSSLSKFEDLESLTLKFSEISDISFLSSLRSLEELNLSYSNVSDISPLSGLTNLERLNLRHNKVSRLSPLSGLNNLEVLNLGGLEVSNLSPLSELSNLKVLNLEATEISELAPLANLNNLEKLYLGSTDVSDLSPLYKFESLELVNLKHSWISNQKCKRVKKKLPDAEVKCPR